VALREEIDEVNDRVCATVNNGVYQAGFATTQEACEDGTEADVRLCTTAVRFDTPHGRAALAAGAPVA